MVFHNIVCIIINLHHLASDVEETPTPSQIPLRRLLDKDGDPPRSLERIKAEKTELLRAVIEYNRTLSKMMDETAERIKKTETDYSTDLVNSQRSEAEVICNMPSVSYSRQPQISEPFRNINCVAIRPFVPGCPVPTVARNFPGF